MSTIQEKNYFELLGLPVSFEVDSGQLNDHYRKIQKSIHPDNFSSASDMERRLSVQKAAQVNDAFQTLKVPLKRALYLLTLAGIEIGENDNSLEPGFLMEQIELRESLAAAAYAEKPLDALQTIDDDVKARLGEINQQLSDMFQLLFPALQASSSATAGNTLASCMDKKQNDTTAALKAKQLTLKMQFLNRLQEECMNMEEDLVGQI